MSVSWNPWHGCRKLSEGCRHCYVYRQDAQHDKDSREVRRTAAFNLPVRRTRDGRYKVPPGEMVYTCFTSDFLVEEADAWRAEAWEMIRIRSDLRFFFITSGLRADWLTLAVRTGPQRGAAGLSLIVVLGSVLAASRGEKLRARAWKFSPASSGQLVIGSAGSAAAPPAARRPAASCSRRPV